MEHKKRKVRERILKLLESQKEEERLAKSLLISDKLFSLQEIKNSRTILFYASFDGEVNTFEMIKRALKLKKTIALPRIIGDTQFVPTSIKLIDQDLETGRYGIQQPKSDLAPCSESEIDVVVVPGLAFDRGNYRLGRGKGYYDRFLQRLPAETIRVGIGFDFQIVDNLPREVHDLPVTKVLTN